MKRPTIQYVITGVLLLISHLNFSQVGIGTTTPNSDALLDIDASTTTGGLLLPRLALTNTTSPAPLTADVAGMTVYNTAIAGDVTPGFYYNNGNDWVRLDDTGRPVNNGLNYNVIAQTNQLGGDLTENTMINQGAYNMVYNLNNAGDFHIQDNGVNHFSVRDNGNTIFGGDVQWRDENTNGRILAQLIDSGNDGRFIIRENGLVAVDLNANSQFVFNELGYDRNFRIESNLNTNMFFLDAGTNRVGIGTNAPTQMLHVNTDAKINTGLILGAPTNLGNHLLMIGATTNAGVKLGHTGAYNDTESGRFAFDENADATPNTGTFCGFEWHHDGSANELYLSSGCTAAGIRMTIERGGQIGISTPDPTANLSVNGTANKTGGGTWAVFSDARLKKNVSNYTEGLDFIKKIRTVNFTYNNKMDKIWGENPATKGKIYQGVIAQELQKIAPDMVNEVNVGNENNPNDADYRGKSVSNETYLEVDPNKFTYALINAIKEQQEIIKNLEERVENLEK